MREVVRKNFTPEITMRGVGLSSATLVWGDGKEAGVKRLNFVTGRKTGAGVGGREQGKIRTPIKAINRGEAREVRLAKYAGSEVNNHRDARPCNQKETKGMAFWNQKEEECLQRRPEKGRYKYRNKCLTLWK